MTSRNNNNFVFSRIFLGSNNRMVRIGFGKHDGNWFARIDLWWMGFRIAKSRK